MFIYYLEFSRVLNHCNILWLSGMKDREILGSLEHCLATCETFAGAMYGVAST